ncbi:hypothetical protein NHQ30_007602 [Ciborinia camelliae]|nr:hypothetical protein NHQ30_007602 [Ciborinia camelliae]
MITKAMKIFGLEPQTWAGLPNNHLSFFRLFSRLPPEIRKMIWEEVCRQGRVVTVFPTRRILKAEHSQGHGDLSFYAFKSCDPIPAILHANHEARAVALKFYKLAFDTQAEFPLVTTMDHGTNGCIWINPSCDLICPMSSMTDSQCDALNEKMYELKVQRIGLNDCVWQKSSSMPCDKWGTFTKISPPEWMNEHIKEVTLYTSRYMLFPSEELELTEFDFATAYLNPRMKKLKLELMRRHNQFFEDLRRIQKLQLQEDVKNTVLGRNLTKLKDCPQWLYDCRGSWCKPQQRSMTSNVF